MLKVYENIFVRHFFCSMFAIYSPHSHQANSEVFLVLFLASLYLDLTLLLRVLKCDISKGISLSEQHLISGFCLGEVGQGHAARLIPVRLHLNGLHNVVALLWSFVHLGRYDGAISHFLPRQCTNLQTFHCELLVRIIESSLVLLREEWSALLITLELQARYSFDVRHAFR